ncbi:MAG: LytR/AlgR family response regulator transcription factor [Candidatus Eiseniibacteriota bacterium]
MLTLMDLANTVSGGAAGAPVPLRVVLVDDEALARSRVRRLLGEIGGADVVGEADSVPAARNILAQTRPDLVLLDVQMPGEDGFALLEGLSPRPAVVFVTAFDHYAVRAFEENAVDYLLKPFRKERLAEALERARRDLARPEEVAARLSALVAALGAGGAQGATVGFGASPAGGPAALLERFTVRVGTRQIILQAEEILWFGAEEKLVFAATESDRHWLNFTLDQLEKRLDPRRFARVHRGAIVNLDYAAALKPGFAGTYTLVLKDRERTEVPVSRARARALKDRLGA